MHVLPFLSFVFVFEDGLSPAFYLANRFLLLEPPATGPAGGSLPRAIRSILQRLTPRAARYRVFAKDVANRAKELEPVYGAAQSRLFLR